MNLVKKIKTNVNTPIKIIAVVVIAILIFIFGSMYIDTPEVIAWFHKPAEMLDVIIIAVAVKTIF
ncbi:MAG: hypothetical protein WC878_04705 [Candidatus Paceibacterota bacterium]|jgi:hypothetical protein